MERLRHRADFLAAASGAKATQSPARPTTDHPMNDQKNPILAIVLSALVLIASQDYFRPPQKDKQKKSQQQQHAQERPQQPPPVPQQGGTTPAAPGPAP